MILHNNDWLNSFAAYLMFKREFESNTGTHSSEEVAIRCFERKWAKPSTQVRDRTMGKPLDSCSVTGLELLSIQPTLGRVKLVRGRWGGVATNKKEKREFGMIRGQQHEE